MCVVGAGKEEVYLFIYMRKKKTERGGAGEEICKDPQREKYSLFVLIN